MTKKILVTTGFILMVYYLIVQYYPPHSLEGFENWNQKNLVRAEKYLLSNQDFEYVITGSSITNLLNFDTLSTNHFNLSLIGLGALDGLKIASKRAKKPKIVLIEVNYIGRYLRQGFHDIVFNPVILPIKQKTHFLKASQKPNPILADVFHQNITSWFINPAPKNSSSKLQLALKNRKHKWIKHYKNVYTPPIDSISFNKTMNKLSEFVTILQREGTIVIFYETPVDPVLYHLSFFSTYREAIKERLIGKNIYYIDAPPLEEYQTGDGVHLDISSRKKYVEFLMTEIKSISK